MELTITFTRELSTYQRAAVEAVLAKLSYDLIIRSFERCGPDDEYAVHAQEWDGERWIAERIGSAIREATGDRTSFEITVQKDDFCQSCGHECSHDEVIITAGP